MLPGGNGENSHRAVYVQTKAARAFGGWYSPQTGGPGAAKLSGGKTEVHDSDTHHNNINK
jgi:hypothetical protein